MARKVILCVQGIIGGVDVFSANLASELLARGIESRLVVTTRWQEEHALPKNSGIPIDILPVKKADSWPVRWRKLIRYLEKHSPCIFMPNYDLKYSCVSSALSRDIIVVGAIHSDEPTHYEHAMRMAKYWNGIVSVSGAIEEHLTLFRNGTRTRLETIPYGVKVPAVFPEREFRNDKPLRIVYVGRLLHHQKKVLDLPPIFEKLQEMHIPAEITIVGDGPEREALENRCRTLSLQGIVHFAGAFPNADVLRLLEKQDAIIMVSDYEGMPVSLLEAMGRGCVPVVANIRSGVPELIRDGSNGFLIHRGDVDAFAERFQSLQQDGELRRSLAVQAYQTIQSRYSLGRMVDDYLEFFDHLERESNNGIYVRPKGPIAYPPWMNITWKDYLPSGLRTTVKSSRKMLGLYK